MECFVNANFGGNKVEKYEKTKIDNYSSTKGYLLKSFGDIFMWRSKRQNCITTSTAGAEIVAPSIVCKEVVAMKNLFERMMCEKIKPIRQH